MTETAPPDFPEQGRLLFAGPCDFIFAAAKVGDLPPIGPAEIAFAGRSNVGKSSLLNALTNRKTLARVSHTPGRTQQLNFFDLGVKAFSSEVDPGSREENASKKEARMRLVDMPGYGYAAVGKEKIANWTQVQRDYLRGRATLARVFVLIDGRRGVKPVDDEMFDLLDQCAVSYQVVLTKHDELKVADRAAVVETTLSALAKRPAAYPHIVFTSAQTGEGIPELRAAVAQLLAERGA